MAISKITNSGIGTIDTLAVDTDTLYVDSTNNRVGIGTALPAQNLHIEDTSASVRQRFVTGTTNQVSIDFGDTDSGTIGRITYDHYADAMALQTNGSEAMRIGSSGGLMVGTASNSDYSTALKLYAVSTSYAGAFKTTGGATYSPLGVWNTASSGQIYLITFLTASGGSVGTITSNGSSTSYNTTSDYRLKENVTADWDATTRLKQLNPVRFNFIADPDTTVDGFLAHEVQDIVPEAITGTKDAMRDEEYEVTPAVLDEDGNEVTPAVMGTRSVPDYQGIDQSKLVPLLVKTIQELEARIAALENA